MKKILIFVLALTSTMLWAQNARENWTSKDYWAETQLNFDQVIYGKLNSITCYKSESFFIGCIEAINMGLHLIHKDKNLIYLATPSKSLHVQSELLDFEIEVYNKNDQLDFIIENYITKLKEVYRQYSLLPFITSQVQFESTFKSIEQKLDKDTFSYQTAVIYNTFLSTAYDPHTYIIPTNLKIDNSQSAKALSGKFGFSYKKVNYNNKERMIITELEDGPMKKAGAEVGDLFLVVNGKTLFQDIDKEFDKTKIDIKLIGSQGIKYLSVERGVVKSESVKAELMTGLNHTQIGYISLSSFAVSSACDIIYNKGLELIKSGAEGFILDLRDNGGGLVSVAECIMSLFLEDHSLTFGTKTLIGPQEGKTSYNKLIRQSKKYKAGIFKKYHNVVLINGYSASASEATAIYLQAYRKAFIVGETSYGKGTMQVNTSLANNEYVTFAQTQAIYLGPHGVSPQIQGVKPDFQVYPEHAQKEPTKYTREKDRYKNVISYKTVDAPQMNDRKVDILNIKNCLQQENFIEKSYLVKDKFQKLVYDQQKEAALSVIECAYLKNIFIFEKIDIPTVK